MARVTCLWQCERAPRGVLLFNEGLGQAALRAFDVYYTEYMVIPSS